MLLSVKSFFKPTQETRPGKGIPKIHPVYFLGVDALVSGALLNLYQFTKT